MKNRIKEFYINENGNALILVVLLVMCMMLIAGGVMAVAFSHVEISQAYKRTSNLYYAAQSGAEKMVDQLNKILIEEMPKLTEKAANQAKNKVAPPKPEDPGETVQNPDYDKLKYFLDEENSSAYEGEFLLDNLYQKLLQEKAIETIVGDTSPIDETTVLMEFKYELKNERNKSLVEVQLRPKMTSGKVTGFTVTSKATLKNESDALSDITLEGDIIISDLIGHKELLLEEYRWKDENLMPNTFRSPILTFGDLIVTDGAVVEIDGDVRAKGYIPTRNDGEAYPELEEYGGIYVSHGGKLTINGNATTLANVHTMNKYGTSSARTEITVKGDVIANSVAIEDDYPYHGYSEADSRPIGEKVKNQYITINGDVYVDNDIAIDRYVEGTPGLGEEFETLIKIDGSVYGIMNKDPSGKDPNKSSGIYAIGKKSRIEIGQHAFVHGNAFISFDGGKNFSHLYESIGEPYEDVGYLDDYISGVALGDESYITMKKDYILKDKIKLSLDGHYFYAPRMISANGSFFKINSSGLIQNENGNITISHNLFVSEEQLKDLFNEGGINTGDLLIISPIAKDGSTKKWNEPINKGNNSPKIVDIISDAFSYLKSEGNPFNRKYFSDDGTDYNNMYYYRGIQGYMFLIRDIFYKQINTSMYSQISTSTEKPTEMSFVGDIINSNVELEDNIWTKDTPVYIFDSGSSENNIDINISSFYDGDNPVETIIIDKGEGTISLNASDSSQREFHGLIVSNGRVKFDSSPYSVQEFEGIIIAQGKNNGNTNMTTAQIVSGEYAGVLFKHTGSLTITYDENILFKVKCKNRAIKRAILDYLGLTNYVDNTGNKANEVGPILETPSIAIENIQKVDFNSNSVLDIKNTEAYKGIRFEMRTLRQID